MTESHTYTKTIDGLIRALERADARGSDLRDARGLHAEIERLQRLAAPEIKRRARAAKARKEAKAEALADEWRVALAHDPQTMPPSLHRAVARTADATASYTVVWAARKSAAPKARHVARYCTTPGGKLIRYPGAYRWPKTYHAAVRELTVGAGWVLKNLDRLARVECGL